MDWLSEVITSQFVWGTVLGVCLSVLTARASIYFQLRDQEERVQKFSQDLIRNITDYAESLSEARERSHAIHHDILALIENEIGIWGRNREHLFLISDDKTRKSIRDYFSRCAKLLVDTKVGLAAFSESTRIADTAGEGEGGHNRQLALTHLQNANNACDKLIAHIRMLPVLPRG